MGFVAGGVTATYSATTIGQLEDGASLSIQVDGEDITGNNLAGAVQDGVYRGLNGFISLTLLEYNAAGAQAAFWPWNATLGAMGVVGRLFTALDAALVLTSDASTPLRSEWTTLTASQAILPTGFNLELAFAPKLLRVPLRFRLLPDSSGVLFTVS